MSRYTGGGGYLPLTWWLSGASIDLYFAQSKYFDSAVGDGVPVTNYLTISRASTAYAKTSGGVLTSFATNTLRITDLGLLIEDARTNQLTNSQAFAATRWTDNSSAFGVNTAVAVAPDGTTTADKVHEDTTSAAHYPGQNYTVGNVQMVASIYAKAVERTKFVLDLTDNSSGDAAYRFDLIAGTATSVFTAGSWTGISSSIETLANGWFRCVVTATKGAGTVVTFKTWLVDASNNTSYLGDGTSGIYFWGAQIETNPFVSSYIPTTTTSVTRAQDLVTDSGNLITAISGSAVSVVINCQSPGPITGADRFTLLRDVGGGGLPIWMASAIDTQLAWAGPSFVSGPLTTLGGVTTFSGGVKVGIAEDGTSISQVGGGGTVSVDATNKRAFTSVTIGCNAGSPLNWGGYFRRMTVWNSRIADGTLQGFTV